jgi:hypothetical protein
MPRPTLSIIVVFFNMQREAQRSLFALARAYQQGVADFDYEVIAIDNGSAAPLSGEQVGSFGPQFRYHFFPTVSPSPAAAVNFGVQQAQAEHVMVMVDGAHIVTPRMLCYTRAAIAQFDNPLIAAVSLPLAPPPARQAAERYDQAAEDRRLQTLDWQRNGYQLFRLTTSFGDDANGWFGGLFESACFTMRKSSFQQLGGFDERFQSPGGGLVSLDFFQRALARAELTYVLLLGEATFHQYHGGAATGAQADDHPWQRFHAEYRAIRGKDFDRAPRLPIYLGQFTPESLHIAEISAKHGFAWWRGLR